MFVFIEFQTLSDKFDQLRSMLLAHSCFDGGSDQSQSLLEDRDRTVKRIVSPKVP